MSESKLGAEENVDPSGGSFLESSAESIPGNLSNTHRRHCAGKMTSMLLSCGGGRVCCLPATLACSDAVRQLRMYGLIPWISLGRAASPQNVQLGGCVRRSLPPPRAPVHLAAVQHGDIQVKPDVIASSTYELTKTVSSTLHKVPAPAHTIKMWFVPQIKSHGLRWTGQDV